MRTAALRAIRGPWRVLHLAAWLYLAATVVIAILMWGEGDHWWTATVLLFMGRWVFLLPLVLLLPLALVWKRRLLLPLALGGLIVLGPVMGGRVGWRRLIPPPDGMPLRVVTFNADGGAMLAPLLPFVLDEWQADVVLLQECGEALTAASERVDGWHWHHTQGLCLLTRLPILSADQMDRSALERLKQVQGLGIGGAGYVVRYSLQSARGPISVTNLHLETPRKGFEGFAAGDVARLRENTELRAIESDLARRWVDVVHGPAIVAGDFNTPIESRIFREHWGDLDDAFSRVGTGFGMTKFNGWIRIRIDHVLTRDAWRARTVAMGRDLGSDHRPLIVDLVLAAQ